jgi:tetratricopeptide (TPR) repeat protein
MPVNTLKSTGRLMVQMKRFHTKFHSFLYMTIVLVVLGGCQWFKHEPASLIDFKEFQQHIAIVDEAEAIADPVKRCLHYPTPPTFNWSRALIEALCADMHTPVDHLPKVKRLIDAKDWDGLEAHFTEILRRHYSGEDPEYLIYRSFPLYSWKSQQEADDYTLRWLKAAPDDAYANMTRGNLLTHRAWEVRGGGSSSETDKRLGYLGVVDKKQMKIAATFANEAQILLRKASIIQPRLIVAYNTLINAEMLAGDSEKISGTFDQARRQSPHTYYVRNTLMNFLEPRWGGSLREMDRLVDEAEPHVARNPRLALLRARHVSMAGNRFLEREWYGNALDQYREALEFAPEDNALGTAANIAYRERHYLQAIVYSTQDIRFSRDISYALAMRGSALEKIGEPKRAYCDYQAAIEDYPGENTARRRIPKLEEHFVKYKIDWRTICGPNNPDAEALRKKLGLQ